MLRLVLTLAIAAYLSGCANTTAMRSLATQTSSGITNQQAQMNNFIGAERQQNLDNNTTLKVMRAEAAADQLTTNKLLLAWKLSNDKELLAEEALVTQVQAADILASLITVDPPVAALDDGGAGASLNKANSVLVGMAKKPSAKGNILELFASGNAVYQALEAQKSKAKAPAAAPAAAATSPTPTAKTPAAPAPVAVTTTSANADI